MKENNQRFLFITHQMDRSGAPTSLLSIMEEFNEQGYGDVDVIAMRGGEQSDKFKKLSKNCYVVSDKKKTTVFENFFLFFKLLTFFWQTRSTKTVLINSSVNLRSMLASLIFRKRVFVYVRESENMHQSKLGFLRKRMLGFMTGVICVSHHTAEWVKNYVSPEKICVIHNGMKIPDEYTPDRRHRQNVERKQVGIVGYLDLRKGIDRFYKLANETLQNHADIDFLIIGDVFDDEYRKKIEDQTTQYPYRIKITGIVENVHPFIQQCDVILMLSREEALPRVVMEASYNGVPTLAIDVAGTRELLPVNYRYIEKKSSFNNLSRLLIEILDANINNTIGRQCYLQIVDRFNRAKNINILFSRICKNG